MIPQDIEKYGFKYYNHEIEKINPNRYTFEYNNKPLFQLIFYADTNLMEIVKPIKDNECDCKRVFIGYVKTRQQFEVLLEMLEIPY